ncbi:unnamed protein product [Pleuronectes platessa]|uniref:Uncharacterized protein n=1 Tax=Pleuronectes platessa TaxID=8262 RepID=A0A9N7VA45_PLEPL|nr:unnamed protein product [Pleuronectes platessa]
MAEVFLTSAESLSASCCELNRCEESALFAQRGADRAEESQLRTTDGGGENSALPAASHWRKTSCHRQNESLCRSQQKEVGAKSPPQSAPPPTPESAGTDGVKLLAR